MDSFSALVFVSVEEYEKRRQEKLGSKFKDLMCSNKPSVRIRTAGVHRPVGYVLNIGGTRLCSWGSKLAQGDPCMMIAKAGFGLLVEEVRDGKVTYHLYPFCLGCLKKVIDTDHGEVLRHEYDFGSCRNTFED